MHVKDFVKATEGNIPVANGNFKQKKIFYDKGCIIIEEIKKQTLE